MKLEEICIFLRYQFGADNAGTHFYHSHSGLQKLDGQYGSVIVRQPRRLDPHGQLYDHDRPEHVVEMSDWMHEMANERFPGRLVRNVGQVPENVLINGKGRWKVIYKSIKRYSRLRE